MKHFLGLLLIGLLLFPLTTKAEYQVGELVDDFSLPSNSGDTVSLYDYSDRIVVIPFWETG